MKKKIILVCLIILVLVTGLFTLTGCGNKEEAIENEVEEVPEVVDETLFKINNLEFHLDKEATYKAISYLAVEDFKLVEQDKYIQYNYYQEDQTNLLFFRIFYYESQDIAAAIADLGLDSNISLTNGKTDNIEYKYYAEPRKDGGTIHFYFINNGEDTYVLHFVSKYDIKDFEDKVVKSVKF